MFAAEIAVPGAYGRPLRDGPLLGGLPAGADDAPYVIPPSRRTHGFQVDIDTAAGKAGTYGMGIQFFHAGDCISRAREGQARNTLISRKFFIFLRARKFLRPDASLTAVALACLHEHKAIPPQNNMEA